MATHNQLQEATDYANICVKEGTVDEEFISSLSDDELVRWANRQMDMADAYADSLMEK